MRPHFLLVFGFVLQVDGKKKCETPQEEWENRYVKAFDEVVHFENEKYLRNVKQLTFSGANAEAYFSYDDSKLTYQASGHHYGTDCDQIYELDLTLPPESTIPRRLSSGLGVCTCSFFTNDNLNRIYAGTFVQSSPNKTDFSQSTCPIKQCDPKNPKLQDDKKLQELCGRKGAYIWDIYPDYDIFLVNEFGNVVRRLTDTAGYDAEGVISPDGNTVLFTSKRNGDLHLYTMDLNGHNVKQLTTELGYNGGGFFSPDGSKIIYRASRPKTDEEVKLYKDLLSYDMVEPLKMSLFVYDLNTSTSRQITNLPRASWAPYYLPDNKRIIFSSNFNETGGFGAFSLYVINEDGTNLERVTYGNGVFDSFPMFSYKNNKLVWGSSRNSSEKHDVNIFIADWTDNSDRLSLSFVALFVSILVYFFN
ncbi:hypothetical protein M3Y95_01174400 [Aphelenchoides besseyi]|nr:hypothetical protein M3Y95_01174400 [Aphelenchoides besseyi]